MAKMIRGTLVLFFMLINLAGYAQSDSSFLHHALISLRQQAENLPSEKVYLQLDKPHYELGDTIWYKAYTVTSPNHQLSDLSGVLYAELIGPGDSVIKRQILYLAGGVAWGDMTLPASKPGYYHLRAYTNWMRNAGPEYFYNQKLLIGSYDDAFATTKRVAPATPDIQFFPEGGWLVNGVRSRVAVKSVNPNGLGQDIKGIIEDNDGNVVADFATQHLGMGVFAFTPQSGKTYRAKLAGAGEAGFTTDLPKARDEGFTLSVNNSLADSVYIKIAVNNKLFSKKQNSKFYLVAQSGGKIYYTAAGKLENPVFTSVINKSRFPTGIVRFTLFSDTGEPINERIAFMQNNDTLQLRIIAQNDTFKTRGSVKIDLEIKNELGQPVTGSFSAAVINESRVGVDEPNEPTIFTNLLLTSEVKGNIEQPDYYFTNINEQTRADLDVLMLTQGYRKFNWQQVLRGDKSDILFQPEKNLELEGIVMTPSGVPVVGGKVLLTSIINRLALDTLTAADGSFRFTDLYLADTTKILLKALKSNNGKNVMIYIKQHDYPAIEKDFSKKASIHFDQTGENLVSGKTKPDSVNVLKQVNITGKKPPKPDRFNNYGTAYEYDVNLAQLKDFDRLKDAIGHKIPGVSLDGRSNLVYDRKPLTLMINGLHRSQDDLDAYGLPDIENIRVIDATGSSGPLLMVTTHPLLARDSVHIKLKQVNIHAKKTDKPDKSNHYGTDNPYTIPAERLKDMGPYLNPGLAALIPGVIYSNGVFREARYPYAVQHIVLNDHEIQQTEPYPDNINNYVNTEDIENIKILHGPTYKTMYGVLYDPAKHDDDDIILITTKQFAGTAEAEHLKLKEMSLKNNANAKYVTTEIPTGLISYKFAGYYTPREFYSPKYDNPKTDSRSADLRSTIYWQPDMTLNGGKATLNYFNGDTKGTYRVVLEGIDSNGRLGRRVIKYKVK